MIRRIQALNYRCLRYVDVPLDRYNVLVGPNASGKSTLCDAIAFLADLVRDGLESAVAKRSRNFQDLVWGRPERDMGFELAAEFDIPEDLRPRLPPGTNFEVFRYEVAVSDDGDGPRIHSERGILRPRRDRTPSAQRDLFPDPPEPPRTILVGGGKPGSRTVLAKSHEGTDSFYVETNPKAGKGWVTTIAFGRFRTALGNLPESSNFPVATHVRRALETRVHRLALDPAAMREASPPQSGYSGLAPDGSNLPWVVRRLRQRHRDDFEGWLEHVRARVADLDDVRVVERADDRHAYLVLRDASGVDVPSWMASDGTLRLLALTLLAHLPTRDTADATLLLEEPENGIHPSALETVRESLSSLERAQVLISTHVPALLTLVRPKAVLCFARDSAGATDILRGSDHPRLANLPDSAPMDALFAAGLLDEGGEEPSEGCSETSDGQQQGQS